MEYRKIKGLDEGYYSFACVEWVSEDIKFLQPNWTKEQCEDWLANNEEKIQERVTEFGWQVIKSLL
jgi:hypothetical protein